METVTESTKKETSPRTTRKRASARPKAKRAGQAAPAKSKQETGGAVAPAEPGVRVIEGLIGTADQKRPARRGKRGGRRNRAASVGGRGSSEPRIGVSKPEDKVKGQDVPSVDKQSTRIGDSQKSGETGGRGEQPAPPRHPRRTARGPVKREAEKTVGAAGTGTSSEQVRPVASADGDGVTPAAPVSKPAGLHDYIGQSIDERRPARAPQATSEDRGKGRGNVARQAKRTRPVGKAKGAPPSGVAAVRRGTDERAPSVADPVERPISRAKSKATPVRSATRATRASKPGGGRQMLINAASEDECRIAVMFENRLEELFIERRSSASHVGNIYKGIVVNVEPSIQAVFVDFGLAKHGFLHISDVQPQYFGERNSQVEGVGKKVPRRDRPPIQRCFRRGQEVMVQITKEGVGTKGPTLTTYLSIPGRYLVMMPGMTRLGVSRKIEDDEQRRQMREVLGELKLPKDMGFILRTAGLDRNKRELQRDLNYLDRLWKTVVTRVRTMKAPAELYQESDLVTRTVRDVFTTDVDKVIVDTPETAERVREFLRIAMPRTPDSIVEIYDSPEPIFHHYNVEEQIEAIHSRHVPLPSGGSIVIDSTEALVAIDVNSGKFRAVDDEEELAYLTNLEAAQEIARQLRLRDLGGLIICDFIDMRLDRHKRSIERALRDELKKHKERARILRLSRFGLIEMTRQRQGPSIKRGVYTDCPHCKGSGLVKNPESMTLHVLRNIQTVLHRADVVKLVITVSPDVAYELQNRKRAALHQLEVDTSKSIVIRSDLTYTWDQQDYRVEDGRGRVNRLNLEPE